MPPTIRSSYAKPLLAASLLLLGGGAALAIAQPGDLGDDGVESEGAQGADATTTTASTATTTTATTATTAATAPGGTVTVTTAAGQVGGGATTTTAAGSATTAPGSGLGSSGVSRADDATASTGIESMLGPGLALAAGAVVLRRAARPRQA